MDRITGREDVIDMRLVAGEPNRFANASQIESTPSGAACSYCCLSCESVISLSGIFSAEVNRAFFASGDHGCLLPVFSVASAAAISSNEGTCHNDMYGSGPR